MNFDYLNDSVFAKFKDNLVSFCQKAEQYVFSDPEASVTNARKANEFVVKLCYSSFVDPQADVRGAHTFELLTDPAFEQKFKDAILMGQFHYIRRNGNSAAHGGGVSEQVSLATFGVLFQVVGKIVKKYLKLNVAIPAYVAPTRQTVVAPVTPVQNTPAAAVNAPVVVPNAIIAEFGPRMREVVFDVTAPYNPENEKLYWRACLTEAGWPIVNADNTHMASSAAINVMFANGLKADSVLYDATCKPLAIIDATCYENNPAQGRANYEAISQEIETKYGSKPVVYYKIGYKIFCIDQLGYRSRRVFQIHTIDELETLKQRRTLRQDIGNPTIDPNIAGRPYQQEAITAACRRFNSKERKSLLVMATGTGKTRVAIELVDILTKANWIKRVLFLADRTNLASQAYKNFGKLLPGLTYSVFTGNEPDRNENARVIFSTYQTMMGLINDDTRAFSMAHFDLIIVDEAHRSIFNKYGQLFDYFDSLMLGLTATPSTDDDRNSYEFFEHADGTPDFSYDLDTAIKEKYLVGYTLLDRTIPANKRDVPYDELSDEDKAKIENAVADAVDESDIEIIPTGPIDAMLNDLMTNGLKVEGGDKLGKTIIFAKKQSEAKVIVERFNHLYGHLGDDFCRLIVSSVGDASNLIDNFSVRENLPQVAVSVDMLDTGVDVPDVLNLVFFKEVHSKIKFIQMVGRGTRLSEDIFGQGHHKQGFVIFDYYDNFGFFGHSSGTGVSSRRTKSISQSLFWARLNIVKVLQDMQKSKPSLVNTFDAAYRDDLRKSLINIVQSLKNDDVGVMYHMAWVNKYRAATLWNNLDDNGIEEIENYIVPLVPSSQGSFKVKNFDKLMLNIEWAYIKLLLDGCTVPEIEARLIQKYAPYMNARVDELVRLKTIPAVVAKEPQLLSVRNLTAILNQFSLEKTEKIRNDLRDLMTYLPDRCRNVLVVDTSPEPFAPSNAPSAPVAKPYADKAREYINAHLTDVAFVKLTNLDPLTQQEKDDLDKVFTQDLGSAAECAVWTNGKKLLAHLRTQVGILDSAIQTKLGSVLNSSALNQLQADYLKKVVEYVRINGDVTLSDFVNGRALPIPGNDLGNFFGTCLTLFRDLVNGLHDPIG